MDSRRIARRATRIAALIGAGFLLATFAPIEEAPRRDLPGRATVLAEPVPLDADDPGRRRVGALDYLGGYRLSSADVRFGGISAMHVGDGEVLALSDAGTVFRFPVPMGAGPVPIEIGPLPHGPGTGQRKSDRDSEALALHDGTAWIAFEGHNSVWRYAMPGWRFEASTAPAAMRRWQSNSGSEAMVRLDDGRMLIFAERPLREGTTPALLFEGDPAEPGSRAVALRYRPPSGYRITDAAVLPDGRLLFLNRRHSLWEGLSAVLTIAELSELEPGTAIAGREVATLRSPLTTDNMEALSVTREGGRTILWIASDDNFNPFLQQTLLLKFALVE